MFSPSTWVGDEAIIEEVRRAMDSREPRRADLYVSLGAEEGNRMLAWLIIEAHTEAVTEENSCMSPMLDHSTRPHWCFTTNSHRPSGRSADLR